MGLCCFDFYYFLVYFFMYAIVVGLILGFSFGFGGPLSLITYFLSLGGLPPFLGRAGKLLGVKRLVGAGAVTIGVLILRSIISLGYYV